MIKKRKSFSRLTEVFDLHHLLQTQIDSFEMLLQKKVPLKERQNVGIQEVFQEVFPIESFDRKFRLEFVSYSLGKPKYSVEECKRRGMSYATPLRVNLRLVTPSDVKVQEVYFGDIPLLTQTASFIINGDERVIVSQLQRSPGVSFEEELHPTGKKIFYGRIIPYRGAWLEFKYDLSETILAYVDRKRNFPATQILRIIGFSTDEDIFKAFGGEIPEILNTLKKDFTKTLR